MNAFIAKIWRWWLVLLIVVAAVAVYIWVSADALPAMVVSSVDDAGHAHDRMERETYRNLVLAIATLVPLAIASFMSVLGHLEPDVSRVPHREYWLRPENQAAMYRFMAKWAIVLAIGFCILVAVVHAVVLDANTLQPPRLTGASDWLGYAFKGFTAMMIAVPCLYFFRVKKGNSSIGGRFSKRTSERTQEKMPQKVRRY
jgi:uncharacterized membrane protein